MSQQSRTQKQIAERYKGNLGYYKKNHFWRIASICLASVGVLIGVVLYHKHGEKNFFNPGAISSKHYAEVGNNCAQCHAPTLAPAADNTPANFWQVMGDRFQHGVTFKAVDSKCETCHKNVPSPVTEHSFHEPNVVENRSCSACHLEHQGPGKMKAVASLNCASCHNNREIMRASAQKGSQLPESDFHLRAELAQRVVFKLPRPPEGYNQVFSSFDSGHPEFQFAREKARDVNVLRFNHKLHLEVGLDCVICHQAEGDGRYMQKISFAATCEACHALQFDARNPELTLPHGDPVAVRLFLQTLPSQYEMLAVKKGMAKNPEQARTFAENQMAQLPDRGQLGGDFERQIFSPTDPSKPQPEQIPPTRSSFNGCAFCHEVTSSATGSLVVTKPVLNNVWMPHAHFSHAKHASVRNGCRNCHDAAEKSSNTSDVLLPTKAKCVDCHNPAGKGGGECITCHSYHASPPTATVAQSGTKISFKQMLLGR